MKLAIFDFDGTLVPKDSLPFVLEQWKKQKHSKAKYYKAYFSMIFLYLRYKSGMTFGMTKEAMRILAVKKFNFIFRGMTKDEVSRFFQQCAKEIIGSLNQDIVSEIEACRKDGYHLVLLSGAHEYLLKYVGKHLRFDNVFGTELHFSNNIFDPNREVVVFSGVAKKDKMYEYYCGPSIEWGNSCAYGDSYSDVDLLELVGQSVAVCPDAKLKKIALDRNWRIIGC